MLCHHFHGKFLWADPQSRKHNRENIRCHLCQPVQSEDVDTRPEVISRDEQVPHPWYQILHCRPDERGVEARWGLVLQSLERWNCEQEIQFSLTLIKRKIQLLPVKIRINVCVHMYMFMHIYIIYIHIIIIKEMKILYFLMRIGWDRIEELPCVYGVLQSSGVPVWVVGFYIAQSTKSCLRMSNAFFWLNLAVLDKIRHIIATNSVNRV